MAKITTTPDLEAQVLLAHVLRQHRAWLLAHDQDSLSAKQLLTLQKLLQRRLQHEPMAYLLGHQEFYGLDFVVSPQVLIPRPETELMVEQTLQQLKKHQQSLGRTPAAGPIMIWDMGTGSGAIIISLAKTLNKLWGPTTARENYRLWATDFSEQALLIARQNARRHQLKNIKFLAGSLLKPYFQKTKLSSDLLACQKLIILANLPYLDKTWTKSLATPDSAGLRYEPKLALDGGPDGLKYYRRLAKQIARLRTSYPLPITLYCEIYKDQAKALSKIFPGAICQTKSDLAGLDRLVIIKL